MRVFRRRFSCFIELSVCLLLPWRKSEKQVPHMQATSLTLSHSHKNAITLSTSTECDPVTTASHLDFDDTVWNEVGTTCVRVIKHTLLPWRFKWITTVVSHSNYPFKNLSLRTLCRVVIRGRYSINQPVTDTISYFITPESSTVTKRHETRMQ